MSGAMPSGSLCTQYGRPDRSTAALASVSSSGTTASPNLVMPALSPSASQRLAQREGGVLDRVMRVDVGVPLRLDGQVEQAVLGQLGEHVIEEWHAGAYVGS